MNPQPLDYVVIGAQKCATSWMYYCLRDHPAVCVPTKKLEAGYIGGTMQKEKGDAWFFDRFQPKPGQIVGDVSVEYLWDGESAEALHAHAGQAKLIVSLRQPVDRTISGYFWLLRKGDLPNVPIEEGIAPLLDAKPGFPDPLPAPLDQAVRRSLYAEQLQRYIEVFGADRIKVVLYEDIAEDGLAEIRSVYRYLGVDPEFEPPSLNSAPKKNSYNRWLLAIENSTRSKVVAKLCNYAHQVLTYVSPRPDIIPRKIRRKLNELFEPAIRDTLDVLDRLPEGNRPSRATVLKRWTQD